MHKQPKRITPNAENTQNTKKGKYNPRKRVRNHTCVTCASHHNRSAAISCVLMMVHPGVVGTSSLRCSVSAYTMSTTIDIVFFCCSFSYSADIFSKILTGQAIGSGLLCTISTSWPRACEPFKVARGMPWGWNGLSCYGTALPRSFGVCAHRVQTEMPLSIPSVVPRGTGCPVHRVKVLPNGGDGLYFLHIAEPEAHAPLCWVATPTVDNKGNMLNTSRIIGGGKKPAHREQGSHCEGEHMRQSMHTPHCSRYRCDFERCGWLATGVAHLGSAPFFAP